MWRTGQYAFGGILWLIALLASSARAAPRSEFRLQRIVTDGAMVRFAINWRHFGPTQPAQFYIHRQSPSRDLGAVMRGVYAGDLEMRDGAGQAVLSVKVGDLRALNGLESSALPVGENLSLCAFWPRLNHFWGERSTAGTSAVLLPAPSLADYYVDRGGVLEVLKEGARVGAIKEGQFLRLSLPEATDDSIWVLSDGPRYAQVVDRALTTAQRDLLTVHFPRWTEKVSPEYLPTSAETQVVLVLQRKRGHRPDSPPVTFEQRKICATYRPARHLGH